VCRVTVKQKYATDELRYDTNLPRRQHGVYVQLGTLKYSYSFYCADIATQ